MSVEDDLRAAAAEYKGFLAAGGHRGSVAGRRHRHRVSDLMVRVKEDRAREERITEEDEVRATQHVDVFGD